MLESWPVAMAVGTVLGFLSGLGVGGGSLLVLWLTLVLGMEHSAARGINLLFFLPSSIVACFFRWRQGAVDWKAILPAVLTGCAAAALASWVGVTLDLEVLKKLFGGLLVVTGLRELFFQPKQ